MSTSTDTRSPAAVQEGSLHRPRLRRGLVVGSLVWSFAVGALLAIVAGWGPVAAAVVGVLVLMVSLPALSARVEGRRRAKDRFVTVVVTTAFALAIAPLLSLLWTVLTNGSGRFDLEFFTSDMRGVLGPEGGALHAIVGTLLVTGAAAVISIPVGVLAAIYLVEYGRGAFARAITLLVDVMTGIPSIVAGLFAFAFFAIFLGPSVRFGIGGAVALSVLMVPVVVRSVEEMLKLVPNELREASYALGVPKWRTIVKVVLPTATAGIAAGVTLSIARVIGETAPLLIIAGSTTSTSWNLFDGRMMTLPVFTYSSYTIPGVPPEEGVDRAWAAALTLLLIVMALNLLARVIAKFFGNPTSR